jgi:hypothetical protein
VAATLPDPARVATWAGDVGDAAALAAAIAAFRDRFGVPDVVVANAGVSRGTRTEFAEDAAAFRAILDQRAGHGAHLQPLHRADARGVEACS